MSINLRTFDLNLLRVFEAISRDGNVSKAADQLGMSQSAVSNALNRLRNQFGDPLFVRTRHGMEPTPRAAQLTEALLHGMSTIRSALSEGGTFDPAVSTHRFTLLMTDVGQIAFLPTILSRIASEAPHVDLSVIEYGLERYEELLENGTADLAIGRISLSETLMSEQIHSAPFVVLLMRDHPLLRRDPRGELVLDYASYLAAPHVSVRPRGATGDPVSQALGADARKRRIALSIPHATALPTIIENTELIATIPSVCARYLVANSALVTVAPPLAIESNHVHMWWHKRNSRDAGHRWLRQLFATAGV